VLPRRHSLDNISFEVSVDVIGELCMRGQEVAM
jgi:hypothetical protein